MKQSLLSLSLLLLPLVASADDNVCGSGVTYAFSSKKDTLTISRTPGEGTGVMYSFTNGGGGGSGETPDPGIFQMPNKIAHRPGTIITIQPEDVNYPAPWKNDRNKIEVVVIEEGVMSVGNYAFWDCDNLTAVKFPTTVCYIGACSFLSCESLASLNLPAAVYFIGNSAFAGCKGLTSLTIPENVTSINDRSFRNCKGLASVNIPEGVTTIGESAFDNCTELKRVTIPASVETIKAKAFYQCPLEVINARPIVPPTIKEASAFTVYGTAQLNVPLGCTEPYRQANCWKEFKKIVDGLIAIKMSAADTDCTAMTYSCLYGLDFTDVKGVTAWTASGVTDQGDVLLSNVKVVPPRTGVILISDEPGAEVSVPVVTSSVWYANLLRPAVEEQKTALTETVDDVAYTNFVQKLSTDGETVFVPLTKSSTQESNEAGLVGPNEAYLPVPSSIYTPDPQNPVSLKLKYTIQGDMNGDKKLTPADAIMVLYRYFGVDTGNGSRATNPITEGVGVPE